MYSIDYSGDGSLLATGGKDSAVRVYDEATKALVIKMRDSGKKCGHSNRIFCVKYDKRDNNLLASGGWDNTI